MAYAKCKNCTKPVKEGIQAKNGLYYHFHCYMEKFGGEGSGNIGHEGLKGVHGGSLPSKGGEIEPAKINYDITKDSELGIYIKTIGVPEGQEGKGLGTQAIIGLINKNPKNNKITFSSPLSKGGKALTESMVRKGYLTPTKDVLGKSTNIFTINRDKLPTTSKVE